MCFPRLEVGQPTVCAETCVGRLRYIGLFLYDADKVLAAASVKDDQELYEAQLDLLLDPNDPQVIEQARRDGIPEDWLDAAKRSPVYALAKKYKVALPLHPEYRTMPMVWYIPPLSPVVDALKNTGNDAEDVNNLFAAIDTLRIPAQYLANLMSAGDVTVIDKVLKQLAAMRSYMRDFNLGNDFNEEIPNSVGMSAEDMYEMYKLLAIAKYQDRYVIPAAHQETADKLEEAMNAGCSVDFTEIPGGPTADRKPIPIALETFHLTKKRAVAETHVEIEEEIEKEIKP